MSFLDNIIRKSSDPFVLVKAHNSVGIRCYFILVCKERDIALLKENTDQDSTDISRYGKIIAKGFGHIPEQAVIDDIQQRYDYDIMPLI